MWTTIRAIILNQENGQYPSFSLFMQEGRLHNGLSIIVYLANPLQQMNDVMEVMRKQHFDSDIKIELLLIATHWEKNISNAILSNCFLPGIEIRFITEFRSSQAFARESGIRSARYELIGLLRIDSFLPQDALNTGYAIMTQDFNLGAYATSLQLSLEPTRSPTFGNLSPIEPTGTCLDESDFLNILFIRKTAWLEIYENGFFLHLARIDNSILEDREICSGIKLCGWKTRFDRQSLSTQSTEYKRFYKKYLKSYQLEGKADPILECYHLYKNAQEYSEVWWQEFWQMSKDLFLSFRSLIRVKNFNLVLWVKFRRRLTAWVTLVKLYPSYSWHSHQIRFFILRARYFEMRKENSKVMFDPWAPLQM